MLVAEWEEEGVVAEVEIEAGVEEVEAEGEAVDVVDLQICQPEEALEQLQISR